MVRSSHANSRVLTVMVWIQALSIHLWFGEAEGGIDDGSGVAFARAKRRRPAAMNRLLCLSEGRGARARY
jgi:hypothetical protein